MNNGNAPERAAALVHQALDVLKRAGDAPDSPVNSLLSGRMRRQFRRNAERLRQRKAVPRYSNLYTCDELADICERTARRDEILEQGRKDFRRISNDLRRVLDENDPGVGAAMETLWMEAERAAEQNGPRSEAAQRYLHLQFLIWRGLQYKSQARRQKLRDVRFPLAANPLIEVRNHLSAAEVLLVPPPGEAVIAIPPEHQDPDRERIHLRIGIGQASWVGSFACGHTDFTTVAMMPDHKHLLVVAEGAGYVIDLRTLTLTEPIGTEIAGVIRNEPLTILIVDHNGTTLEAFGNTGRLWTTEEIAGGEFRGLGITNGNIVGEGS